MRLSGEGLAVTRGGRTVFAGLDFVAEEGCALILTGPNGAGKSTLLRLIAGLLRPDAGTLRLEGDAGEEPIGARSHYVGHLDALKGALSAEENLAFWAGTLGGGDALEALEAVGLAHLAAIPAGLLSAGQKRRVALARLCLAPRPLWLLDEPTSSLDSAAQETFAGLMQAHLDGGGLLIAATHMPLGLTAAVRLDLGARP